MWPDKSEYLISMDTTLWVKFSKYFTYLQVLRRYHFNFQLMFSTKYCKLIEKCYGV